MELDLNQNTFTPGLNKLIHHQEHLAKIERREVVGPINVDVWPNNYCNFNCKYCCFGSYFAGHKRDGIELELKDFNHAIDVLQKYGLKAVSFSVAGDEIVYINHNNEFKVLTIRDLVNDFDKYKNSYSWALKDTKIKGKITNVYKHYSQEDLIKITLNNGKTIKTTKSHSIFFYENEKIFSKEMSGAKEGDLVVLSKSKLDIDTSDSIEIDVSNFKNIYKDKQLSVTIDKNVARLLGYFNAEGNYIDHRDNHGGISLSFSNYEKEFKYIDDVINIFEKYFNYTPNVYKYKNRTQIIASRKWISELFRYLNCGEYSRGMRTPNIIYNLSDDCKYEYLKGLFAGDGNYRNNQFSRNGITYNRNTLQLKTVSIHLIHTVSLLLDILKIKNTIIEGRNNKRFIDGRELPISNYYTLNISGYDNIKKIEPIINFLGEKINYKETIYSTTARGKMNHSGELEINNDAYAIPIKKVEVIPNTGEEVYDITVENTNRFESSFRILCHNSGGGNPIMWKHFDDGVDYVYEKGLKLSLVTNGPMALAKSETLAKFNWIRISIQSLNHAKTCGFELIPNNVRKSMSYIIFDEKTFNSIEKVSIWAKETDTVIRVAPIRPCKPEWSDKVRDEVNRLGKPILFFDKPDGAPNGCYFAYVRGAIDWRGQFLPCPSIELSPESFGKIPDDFAVCHVQNLEEWLINNPPHDLLYRCSHCNCGKNVNNYIDNLMKKVEDVDFV